MKNKKVVWIVIGIVSVALIALAITYAYWQITASQQGVNEISSACLDISLVDAESGNTGVTLQDQFPLSDTEGAKLKPYKFTVTNNCDVSVDYQIALESTGSSTDALKASSLKVMLDDTTSLLNAKETVTPTIDGAYASHKLGMGTLAKNGDAGSSVTHELRLWIDEDAPVSENNRTYNGKITVTIGQGISNFVPLKDTLLAAYGGESAITELDSSAFETSASEVGMYKAQDDYGTSYYYRGDITNNYVKFGEYKEDVDISVNSDYNELDTITIEAGTPMYWRIVRINGDGTIRLIYAGTEFTEDGKSTDDHIYYGLYNNDYSHKMHVGYMYGTEDDPYGDNESTTLTDSAIKVAVDDWYESTLKTNYEYYIADTVFCNDREEYETFEDGSVSFGATSRMNSYEPSLSCQNKRDRFTVDDTTLGNSRLSNPVGLITADELLMAGPTSKALYNNNIDDTINLRYWTMTPFYYNPTGGLEQNGIAYIYSLFANQLTADAGDEYTYYYGASPVINLKSDVEFTYNNEETAGTFADPYVITTN